MKKIFLVPTVVCMAAICLSSCTSANDAEKAYKKATAWIADNKNYTSTSTYFHSEGEGKDFENSTESFVQSGRIVLERLDTSARYTENRTVQSNFGSGNDEKTSIITGKYENGCVDGIAGQECSYAEWLLNAELDEYYIAVARLPKEQVKKGEYVQTDEGSTLTVLLEGEQASEFLQLDDDGLSLEGYTVTMQYVLYSTKEQPLKKVQLSYKESYKVDDRYYFAQYNSEILFQEIA